MVVILLILATALMAGWLSLLHMVSQEDWITAAYNRVLENRMAIEKLYAKDKKAKKQLEGYHGMAEKAMRLLAGGNYEKAIAGLQHQNEQLQQGNLKSLGILIMPGYVLQRKVDAIRHSNFHKNILTVNLELYGKKHAANITKQMIAKLISYPIIGMAVSLGAGIFLIALGAMETGLMVLGVGTLLVLVLAYAMYDEINDQAQKRRAAIVRQFPNMVSKLALLVTSGMNMDRAWKETAYSQELELYREMQKTAEELNNLISPEAAYGGFINRCNTKETAKLASAIMQNLSKGNAEIGTLLKEMAREAWLERRHMAKRDSEKANSKLMIPTMLLFVAILVMLMVPVVISFSSL